MPTEVTMRDHFAAAALTGLLARPDVDADPLEHHFCCEDAYKWADAMLRERERKNHDAAPAARADLPDECPPNAVSANGGTPCAASRDGSGTGGTQEPVACETNERSVASAGSVAGPSPFAWAVCNPVGVHYRSFGYRHEALECCLQKIRETGDCFYLTAMYAGLPQDKIVHLPGLDPNGAPGWNAAIGAVREALAAAGVDWDTE